MIEVDDRPEGAGARPRLLDGEGELVPLARAARKLGKNAATLWRWREYGVRVRGADRRVKLTMVRLGGRWCVRPSDLDAFVAAAAADDAGDAPELTAAIAVAGDKPERAEREMRKRAAAAGESLRKLAPARRSEKGGVG